MNRLPGWGWPTPRRMSHRSGGCLSRGTRIAVLLLTAMWMPEALQGQITLIQADRVVTSTSDGIVGPRFILLREGRIASVTRERPTNLGSDIRLLSASVVAPGFIDARSTLGLSGLHPDDDDRDETSGPNQAHLRAIDAFDPADPMVGHALRNGVTTVQTGPGDANSIGGQAAVFKLGSATVAGGSVRAPSAVALSLTETAKLTYGSSRGYPSTRMANVGLIRQAFLDAAAYLEVAGDEDSPPRDLKKEALGWVLSREIPALVSADRADELATALRLQEEFDFELLIVGAAEAQIILDRLADTRVPILLSPAEDAAIRDYPSYRSLETARKLQERGVPFALVTGDNEGAPRTTLLEVAKGAMRGGLTLPQAMDAITISPARILGLAEELGSIEVGKRGDLVLFDGDPSLATTRVIGVLVGGALLFHPET